LRGTVHSPAFRTTYTYDAAHRLQSVTDSRGPKTLTYTYRSGGLRNAMTDSDGNRTTYLYDGVGRLTGLRAPTGDLTAFAYDRPCLG
jgi:YD repeat-containing protein